MIKDVSKSLFNVTYLAWQGIQPSHMINSVSLDHLYLSLVGWCIHNRGKFIEIETLV